MSFITIKEKSTVLAQCTAAFGRINSALQVPCRVEFIPPGPYDCR